MNRQEDLNDVLKMLADAGPREAPERVEMAVVRAYRKDRGARRMRRVVASMGVVGAVAAGIAVVLAIPKQAAPPDAVTARMPPPAIAWSASPAVSLVVNRPAARVHKSRRAFSAEQVAISDFVPLSYGDDALIAESARIVRVVLPRSALRMAGFNVAQEQAADRVRADILLGADGLAHAVRVVNE